MRSWTRPRLRRPRGIAMSQVKLTPATSILAAFALLILGLSSQSIVQGPPTPTPTAREFIWVKLGGDWTLTWYGSEADGFLGLRHGAAWNGLACKDWTRLPAVMPVTVTASHFGVAMPGIEYYCMPIRVCVAARCIVATAVDTPHDVVIGGKPHVDAWQAVARELGVQEAGIVTATVYVGEIRETP
jgi:hypothetical protein